MLPTARRGFLARLALGVAGLAAAPRRAIASASTEESKEDERWLARITGKHRQFFDATTANDGFGLMFAMNFLDKYNSAYNLPDRDLTAVVGLRHFATPIALNDAMWAKYKLGEMMKVNDPRTKAPATRNPFLGLKDGDYMTTGLDIEKLRQRGVIFTACNVALTVLSGLAAPGAGTTPAAAYKEWTEQGMLPDVAIVPVGVLAVNRAQEKQCTYCYAG
jgi:intracellular sulfur oxidation DsrE/DsrF family protein